MIKLDFLNVIFTLSLVSFVILFWLRIGGTINSWWIVFIPVFFSIIVVIGIFIFVEILRRF
jgi:hypothetical protein